MNADFTKAVSDAVRAIVTDLFTAHPDEHFYYVALVTSGSGDLPVISAWSKEALERALENDEDMDLLDLKWSYADSPFCNFSEHHLEPVREILKQRWLPESAPDDVWDAEVRNRLAAMETAIQQLDKEGLFGVGADRANVVVTVEVAPPDHTNTERAIRLNPREALEEWLEEAAEEAEEEAEEETEEEAE